MYLAEAQVPDTIAQDLILPSLIDNHLDLDKIFFWEGYNTSSLPHTDDVENIMCVFTGQKTWKVVSPFNRLLVYSGKKTPVNYTPVDFYDPNYEEYPLFDQCKVYTIELKAGDCFYNPLLWWHHV